MVEVLIKAGCTLDDVDKFGRSPLMWATACGHAEVVKLLIKAGASVATQGNWHALHEACKRGFIELARLLMDAGAPVNNPRHCKSMIICMIRITCCGDKSYMYAVAPLLMKYFLSQRLLKIC